MRLIKKLVDWFEDLLWKRAIEDVFENPEYDFVFWLSADKEEK